MAKYSKAASRLLFLFRKSTTWAAVNSPGSDSVVYPMIRIYHKKKLGQKLHCMATLTVLFLYQQNEKPISHKNPKIQIRKTESIIQKNQVPDSQDQRNKNQYPPNP